jgi:hypothetical protein
VLADADAQHFDGLILRECRARLAFLQRNDSKMEEQWRWAEGKPEADHRMLYDRALTEAYYGHYNNYRKLAARAMELAAGENEFLSVNLYTSDGALNEAEAGNLTQAQQLAEKGLKGPQQRDTRPILALALCALRPDFAGSRIGRFDQ